MHKKERSLTRKSSRAEIDRFISKVGATPSIRPARDKGRLIFAMDATASREPTWDRACHIQAEMFEETAQLGGLEIQLCYYRGYAEFNATPWLSHSNKLLQRMTGVRCLGGQTQIEKVLKHAVREAKKQKVNAVVFVGDCMEENVDRLCQIAGELCIYRVPVFLFHEGFDSTAERAFKQIAKLTEGAYCRFDVNSAQELRDLLSAVAVYAAGGHAALENFTLRKGPVVQRLTHQISKSG